MISLTSLLAAGGRYDGGVAALHDRRDTIILRATHKTSPPDQYVQKENFKKSKTTNPIMSSHNYLWFYNNQRCTSYRK